MAHIILADDDDLVLEVFGAAFRRGGHSVGLTTDGEEVYSVLASRRVDCLVLDWSMPKISGLEVLWQLRASERFCRLPVIMLTARTSHQDAEVARNSRVDLYCTKACDPDWLVYQAEILMEVKNRPVPPAPEWQSSAQPSRLNYC